MSRSAFIALLSLSRHYCEAPYPLANMSRSIVIASLARTPIAKFGGSFQSLSATQLGATAIRGALHRLADHDVPTVREAFMGNVVSAGLGQAPARQAVKGAGLPDSTVCTTINKVCASGMKSVMLAAQTLQASSSGKDNFAMIAGGMESMSNIPRYLKRTGPALGHLTVQDGLIHDGLWDVYNDQHMGMCGEKCANDYHFSRQDQDAYTIASYERARTAIEAAYFTEVVPVEASMGRKGTTLITKDEEPFLADLERLASLNPAFDRENGSVTAGNAASLNDGAAALVLMTEKEAKLRGIPAVARILGWGDAEQDPADFTTTPSLAVPAALEHAGLSLVDVDYHEINEAFAVVALANMHLLGLSHDRVNVLGGAVALGHPIGMSGARILGTLLDVLRVKDATIGCASICNGGGGASAMILERLV